MNVNIGKLNKRIQIVEPSKAKDSEGYDIQQDGLVHSCWAQFRRMSAKESVENDADFTSSEARFLIRWIPKEINRKMFILYGGHRYSIEYVNDYNDSRDFIELVAKLKTTEAGI